MNCLIIHGSYRKGNTYKVSHFIKQYMQTQGPVAFEEIFLNKLSLAFCLGCNQCFIKGESFCPHQAIIQPIVKKISSCDALIITSPTYSLQVPGLLKCWLDHMSYHFHRPSFFDKKALVIVTTAGGGAKSTARYIKEVLECWGLNHISLFPIRCFSFNYTPDQKALDEVAVLAYDFYKEVASNKAHRPSMKRLFLFNLWRSMAMSGQKDETADFLYWSKIKLLDQPYPPGISLNKLQRAWAHLAYKSSRKMLR